MKSLVFIDLNILGRIAQLEIFFSFIIAYHIYEKFNKEGFLYNFAYYLRCLFFGIIPVCFLPSIYKYYYSYLPILLWSSVLIALFLYFYLKELFMLYEFEIIFFGTSLFSIFNSFLYITKYVGRYSLAELTNHNLLIYFNSIVIGIPTGIIIFLGILYFTGGFKKESYDNDVFKRIYSSAFIYIAYAIFLYVTLITNNIYAGLCAFILYSLYISFKRPVKPWFLLTYKTFFKAIFIAIGFMAAGIIFNGDTHSWIYLLIATAGTGFFIHKEKYFLNDSQPVFNEKKLIYFFFNTIVILLFLIILHVFHIKIKGPYFTILLVIQGTILLFGTLKPVYQDCMKIPIVIFSFAFLKLIFFDLSGLPIIGKVIVFMGVGLVLIIGAYQFQKLKIKYLK